jgi:Xaa-Pro dipeptidase
VVRRGALAIVLAVIAIPVAAAQPLDPYADEPPPTTTTKGKGKGKAKGKTPKPPPAPPAPPAAAEPAADAPRDPYGDAAAEPPTAGAGAGLDVEAVQGLLAVQSLSGWLLYDRDGQNPIARKLVAPQGAPARAWFYLIPATGEPQLLCHHSEAQAFDLLPGKKLTYAGYRDLGKHLKAMLKGKKSIAMEYSPKGAVPSVSRVDAGTLELVKGLGVTIKSSAGLVQLTKALWGAEGRKQHHVAVHHLTELRKDALSWLARQVRDGKPVTELDVHKRIVRGMKMRGLDGPPPVVAAGVRTADPYYVPSEASSSPIALGDLVVVSLAARTPAKDGIFAATTWVAYVGDKVPDRIATTFEVVSLARDEAIAFITERLKRRRAIKGSEVDQAARSFVTKAGHGERFIHRTGHALDSELQGSAADLDDYEVKDTRPLVVGSGFTIGPGIYYAGELGVRAEVSAFLGPGGLEVTTPKQEAVEPLLAK